MTMRPSDDSAAQVQRIVDGDRRTLARLLTDIENERPGVENTLNALFPHTGRAWIIGVTGAPGTGKSTLVTVLAKTYRAMGKTVGILAVDPTSPFTGGAILGDRIRMRDLSGDTGVFIRSMATRGSLGGLARATRDAARVLDAAGFDRVLVETVGAGQSEVDIARMANTTLVVEAPGLGDDVQAIKAGILEIADVLVVNKADRPGVGTTLRALRTMLDLGHPAARSQLGTANARHHGAIIPAASTPDHDEASEMWMPPIIQTVATDGKGIEEVIAAIDQHRDHLLDSAAMASIERRQIEIELYDRLRDGLMARLMQALSPAEFAEQVQQVQRRETAPHTVVQILLNRLDRGNGQ